MHRMSKVTLPISSFPTLQNFFFDGNDVLALAIRAGNNTWTPVDIVSAL
jgi:hypothetical protein